MGRTSDARERLLAAAADLMHGRGYSAVGVKELCVQAGVKKGSFYHFFPSKSDLALAVLDGQWELFQKEMLEPAFADPIPPMAKLQRLFRMACEFQIALKDATGQTRGCPFGNLALEVGNQDKLIQKKIQEVFQCLTDRLEEVLKEAVAAGDLPEIDTARSAQAYLAFLEGAFLMAKTYDDPGVMEALAAGVNNLLIPAGV